MPGIDIGTVALGIQNPEEKRYEAIAGTALEQISVNVGDHGRQWDIKDRLR